MPILTQIFSYPIKSCGALSHTEIDLDRFGLIGDRRWMLVEPDGTCITQRDYHSMALIHPSFDEHNLCLNAPGMPTLHIPLQRESAPCMLVTVWNDRCEAWDEGDAVAAWCSDFLHMPVRLVRMADSYVRPVDPRYATRPADAAFTDGYPLLIVSEGSLADLNRRLVERGSSAIPIRRFRPNLVVADCEPFAEDTWKTIQIGEVKIDVVKPCARCALPSIDPETATVPDPAEPLATLNTYRKQDGKVMFAQNAMHHAPGRLAVGDTVIIER